MFWASRGQSRAHDQPIPAMAREIGFVTAFISSAADAVGGAQI
jgi:hypothetical protein